MEYKIVIVGVLMMSMMLAHIHVEAKFCCPTKSMKNKFTSCVIQQTLPTPLCARLCGCKEFSESKCPSGYPYYIVENSGDMVNEYCKLGCSSLECGALSTLHNSDASEIVNEAVGQCINACSTLCTKSTNTALETA